MDARLHAQMDYRSGVGFCLGGGCWLFGVAASALYEAGIPAHRSAILQNKSNAYVPIYTETYVKEIKGSEPKNPNWDGLRRLL